MKLLLIYIFPLITFLSFSQKNEYELSIIQHGVKVKIKKNQAAIEKAPFQLVYKFRSPQSWGLIAGSKATIQDAFYQGVDAMEKILLKSEFGGADSYFNKYESIQACEGEIQTSIIYEDDQHHSFDSIYRRGKWIFGVRTVSFLSTEEDQLLVEEWPDSILILATGKTEFKANTKSLVNTVILKINLKEIPNTSALDVKGKKFKEEGETVFKDGCEGCGNLGYFKFLKNGKNVEYLRPGSDTISFGTYKQEKNLVTIDEEKISFSVSSDGTQLIDDETGTKYSLVLQ